MQLTVLFGCVLLFAASHAFQVKSKSDQEIANTLRMATLARSTLPVEHQQVTDDYVDGACGVAGAACVLGGVVDPVCDVSGAFCAGKAIGETLGHLFG